MPQMAPMMWLLMFFLFTITFLLFNILNFFNFLKLNNNFKKLNITKTQLMNNFLIWKW